MNGEGYNDPTADKAVRDYNRMPHEMRKALNGICNIASLLGFEIIAIRDKRTRREHWIDGKSKGTERKI